MPGIQEQIHPFICCGVVSGGGGGNHLTELTCRVPRDDLCLISGLPTPSSSCSTGAKTKKIQRRSGRGELCSECCWNQNGLFKQLTCAPCFQGTDHALVLEGQQWGNVQYIPIAAPKKRGDCEQLWRAHTDASGSGRSGCTQRAAGPSPLTLCTV